MKSFSSKPNADNFELSDGSRLNVVLAYEDFATGTEAMRMLDRLSRRTDEALGCANPNAWKFEVLANPALRRIAADDAADADIVMVAANASVKLMIPVMHWIELWIPRRHSRPGALVALLRDSAADPSEAASTESYLRRCARRADMDFFTERLRCPADAEFSYSCEDAGSRSSDPIEHRASARWSTKNSKPVLPPALRMVLEP